MGSPTELLGTVVVVVGLLLIGAAFGGSAVWLPYRHRPTNAQLDTLARIYKFKSEDYKSLCKDCLTQAEGLSLLAQSIHANNPSEASAKIVAAIDRFILILNERSSTKQFTPHDGVT